MSNTLTVPCNDQWATFNVRPGNDHLHTDQIVVKEIFQENVYQLTEGSFDDTGVCIDLGANIGAFSIYAHLMGAKQVVAYEPDSQNMQLLRENFSLNNMGNQKQFLTVRAGVGAKQEIKTLYHAQGGSFVKNEALTGIAEELLKAKTPPASEEIDIVTLEDVYHRNKITYADVLKIDVEGMEYDIILGASPDIINKARFITLEFNNTTPELFGQLIAKLSLTHNIHIIGSHMTGGQIYAHRY